MSTEAYQVIARRWRPKQFSELVGQDHVVRTLGNAIKMGRIAHAYLFVGPRGTGKTTSARLFAKSLNWENGPSLEVPDDSEIGRSIMEGRCLDVIEIDGASNNSVEQVRDLRDECQYAPSQCRYKIYVIDEVHMLSQQAFNALLKTLEEPPPHVKFVFATTESHKVLPTIVSRCQRFEFRSIPPSLIAEKLSQICKSEEIEIEEEALVAIARMAGGGMRDAQSILDQMISFCGKSIRQEDVLEVYGLVAAEEIERLLHAVLAGDYEEILKLTEEFSAGGLDFYRALLDLSECFRIRLLGCFGQSDKANASPEKITRILDALQAGESMVRLGLSEKSNFEVTLFRAVEAGRTRSIDSVIRNLSTLIEDPVKKKRSELTQIDSDSRASRDKPPKAAIESNGERRNEIHKGVEPSPDSSIRENSMVSAADKEPSQEARSADSDLSAAGLPLNSDKERDQANGSDEKKIDQAEPLEAVEKLRSIDPETISRRVRSLPSSIRAIIEDKFRGEYSAVERIDPQKLI